MAKEFEILKEMDTKKEDGCIWINDIGYNSRCVNLIEAEIETDKGLKEFVFITDIRISKGTLTQSYVLVGVDGR